MKQTLLFSLCISLSVTLVAQSAPPSSARIIESYGRLPLAFEANQGQTDPQVKFLSRGSGYSLFLTPTEAVLDLRRATQEQPAELAARASLSDGHSIETAGAKNLPQRQSALLYMKLVGANAKVTVTGQDELPGKSSYFIGDDPKKWHTNVRQFAKVRYENVYPGVNLVYYGQQRELEYDFVLQQGASPEVIRLGIEGGRRLRLDRGDLVLTTGAGDVHLRAPHIYQERNGVRDKIRGGYVIKSKNEVGFEVAAYDRRRALVIDPVLAYSTYLGGSGSDLVPAIAVDSAGNAYVTGQTNSGDFPTANAIQTTIHGSWDVFVAKINRDGTALVYSTYLGGSGVDGGASIAVDAAGNAYLTGTTGSTNFPTVNAIQPNFGGAGTDAFVAKINAAGNALSYSTYLGGSNYDWGLSIAADAAGRAYVSGMTNSVDFPTVHAFQPTYGGNGLDYAAFVTKVNAAGSLIYSTYLGGSKENEGHDIAVDSAGNAYVTGFTASADFPTANAIQPTYAGGGDAFVTKINANGSALVYSTYLGGSDYDSGRGIAADLMGNTSITGVTLSTDLPMVSAIQRTYGGNQDAFVTKLNAGGSALVYSTYLGGSGKDSGDGIAVNTAGSIYVTGTTSSPDFPTVSAIQPTKLGIDDAFATEIDSDGTALVYSTYLGGKSHNSGYGVAVDVAGSAYLTGNTESQYFPKTLLAFQPKLKGFPNAFVTKIATQTFVSLSVPKLGFRTQLLGTTSATRKLVVRNEGSGTLTINKIYIGGFDAGDFAETNTCGSALAAGASCTIYVTFTPTDKNLRHAVLGMSDSDPASPQALPLGGIGTVVSISKTKLSFGNEPVGTTSAPQNVALTNVGSMQLNFTGITIAGMNASDFSQTNTCGTSLAAGANCRITLTFTPTASGKRTSAVSIGDDGGGSPQNVTLTGTGT